MCDYNAFLAKKQFRAAVSGFEPDLSSYPLFDYQSPIVRWACLRGKAAVFADTGLGKTIMQLAWADQVAKHTGGPVIIFAPLAVSLQTIDEGKKYGINVERANPGAAFFGPNIVITNYEQNFSGHKTERQVATYDRKIKRTPTLKMKQKGDES